MAMSTRVAFKGCVASRPRPRLPMALGRGQSRSGVSVRFTAGSAAGPSTPVVRIDNVVDPFATVVSVQLGEEISEMLGTITALKNLGLNIQRAKVKPTKDDSATLRNKFFLTEGQTSEKIVKSDRLEEIRMTVIESIINEFPEAASGGFVRLAAAATSDEEGTSPIGTYRKLVKANIEVSEAVNGTCSVLKIETADRPGLLVDIVRVLKDVNMNVVSAEVDTVGSEAHDEFFVTYKGEPLKPPMVTLVTNALQYYLSLNEVAREESY